MCAVLCVACCVRDRHMGEQQLSGLLSSMKISNNSADVSDIVALAKGSNGHSGQHYGLACQKHFDLAHPDHLKMGVHNSDNVAIHPNQWFQASVQYYKNKTGTTTTTATAASASASASASMVAAAPEAGTNMDVEPSAVPAGGGLDVDDAILAV